jgi:hypothetical protein
MGRFHNYSFGNILEIALQNPDATRVAGLSAWNQLGRKVKKGERGICILAPMIGVRRKKDEEAQKEILAQNQAVLVGFRNAYVFDVSQTEGKELPELTEKITGGVGEYRERLIDFVIAQGIELEFKKSIAPALGMSYCGKIAILPGQSAPEEFSTLVHELAHENVAQGRAAHRHHQDGTGDGSRGNRFCSRKSNRPQHRTGIRRPYPLVPRQRGTSGGELGNHPENLCRHPLRAGNTSSGHHNKRRSRRRSRTRTGASQLSLLFRARAGLAQSAQTPPARPNPLKESSHEYQYRVPQSPSFRPHRI